MGSAPCCPALHGIALRPSPRALSAAQRARASRSALPFAQPCPASIAVASRFVAYASSARSYLRICPPRAFPVRCRPRVSWLCFCCGRCIEFVMLLPCCSTSAAPRPPCECVALSCLELLHRGPQADSTLCTGTHRPSGAVWRGVLGRPWACMGVLCTYRRYEIALRLKADHSPCPLPIAVCKGDGNARCSPIQAYLLLPVYPAHRETQSEPSAGNPQDVNLGLDDTEDTTPSACQKKGGSAGGRRPQGDRCEVAEACSPVAHTLKSVHSLKCG